MSQKFPCTFAYMPRSVGEFGHRSGVGHVMPSPKAMDHCRGRLYRIIALKGNNMVCATVNQAFLHVIVSIKVHPYLRRCLATSSAVAYQVSTYR